MDHLEATARGATERYLLGLLDPAERDAFEEHFFDCLECAEEVRSTAAILAGARSLPDDAAHEIIDIARKRDPTPASTRASRPLWQRGRAFAGALAGIAAAACFTVAYQQLVTIPRLEDELRQAYSLQPVSSHFLTVARSEAPVVRVGPNDRHVAVTLSRSWDKPFPTYRCELHDASGHVLLTETFPARSSADELELLIPVKNLPAGLYMLVVQGVENVERGAGGPPRDSAPVARYSFHLEKGHHAYPP